MKYIIPISLLFLIVSCDTKMSGKEEEVVARVGNHVLLKNEIPDIFPEEISEADSTKIAQNYLKGWVKLELLQGKAEANLTEDHQQKIEEKLSNTRASLLIFEYEQILMNQRMDVTISEEAIETYYTANSEKFILNKNIVKALYIKLPASAPNIDRVKKWYKSDKDEELLELESYCYQYANKFDDFGESWIYFDDLLEKIPVKINNHERFLRYNKQIEASDSSYLYFAHISEYKIRSDISPPDFVTTQIKSILLNERKIKFIEELENNIYNDALSNNGFIIY